jgi:serpin B
MQRVLHFPPDDNALHDSFSALAQDLAATAKKTVERLAEAKRIGGPSTPIEFDLANRLFAQRGYGFRPAFLDLVKERYGAELEQMDYKTDPEGSRKTINQWVEKQTKDKIRDLIPSGMIKPDARLTLVNALYLRAPWSEEFNAKVTTKEKFLVHGRESAEVPTMHKESRCGYAKREGFQIVSRPYFGGELQFVVLLPDDPKGLAVIEKQLTPKLIDDCAHLTSQKIILHLPKFRLEPPTIPLGEDLKALGMKTAFDEPKGSANFDRMAPRRPNDYLYISAVLHKTYLALDENGTEAAAATAVVMAAGAAMMPQPQPVEVHIDHPFLFMIQHVPSGACVFIGRVTDPR